VLVERADADSSNLGDRIGGEPGPATITQNVSRGIEYRVGCCARTRLPRLFAHGARRRSNASSQMPLPQRNMSNMLAFSAEVEAFDGCRFSDWSGRWLSADTRNLSRVEPGDLSRGAVFVGGGGAGAVCRHRLDGLCAVERATGAWHRRT